MKLNFVKDVVLPDKGIFLSVLDSGQGYYRKSYLEVCLARGILNDAFDFEADPDWSLQNCEDPRVFTWQGDDYYTDNFLDRLKIFNIKTGAVTPIHAKGKNFTYLPGQQLLIVTRFSPLAIIDLNGQSFNEKFSTPKLDLPDSWRGGTAGREINGEFFGFGHQTLNFNKLSHLPFFWSVHLSSKILKIELIEFPGSWEICDPTSIFKRGENWYVLTAQSHFQWTGALPPQPMRTALYQIIW